MLLSAFGEGNFFIEIDDLNDRDARAIPLLANIANDLGVPIVAASDVLYLRQDDRPYGTVRVGGVDEWGTGEAGENHGAVCHLSSLSSPSLLTLPSAPCTSLPGSSLYHSCSQFRACL
jgi:hypothetical protein